MSVELVLAAVAAADLCLKYGQRLARAYKVLKTANEAIRDKVLIIEAIWSRTALQIEFFERMADTLEPEHCRIHLEILEVLNGKLAVAVTKIESVANGDPESGVHKLKYLFAHGHIDSVLSELQQWQNIFDPTWYLILRMGSQTVDVELSRPPSVATSAASVTSSGDTLVPTRRPSLLSAQKLRGMLHGAGNADVHLTLSEDGLDWSRGADVTYASTRIVPRTGSKNLRFFAVDTITCGPSLDVAKTRADAEALARKLSQVDPQTSGLLTCRGLIKQKDAATRQLSSIHLVFDMPVRAERAESSPSPRSLRSLLLRDQRGSLTGILTIARQLAAAVSFVHTCDFVHKNVRPETILVFPPDVGAGTVDHPRAAGPATFLAGFDSFRSVHLRTLLTGDAAWHRNLYRHPSRQGVFAQDEYVMQHDVYSLGVCLLELGLWESFVVYEEDAGPGGDEGAVPSDGLGLGLADFAFIGGKSRQTSPGIKDHLVELARARLPASMGDKYTAVVITCLTCLDEGNADFGDEQAMKDDDGILVGVRFIESVLLKLGDISL